MQGQWIGDIEGEVGGTLRVELERRGGFVVGNAYIFYEPQHQLPGFKFLIRMPDVSPYKAEVVTSYCYSDGGIMTYDDRAKAERDIAERFGGPPVPTNIHAVFTEKEDGSLKVDWSGQGQFGSETIAASKATGDSLLVGRNDLKTWSDFRQWAVDQDPRRFIFRGQSKPFKLTTTFHRTWRSDLSAWVLDDVRRLYGAIIERVSFPLQLGNLEHNAVIWSILQHHGYPTPLLDWSFSPFVSAFFAFHTVKADSDCKPRIFIFDKAAWEESYGRQAFIVDAAPPQLVTIENMAVGNPRYAPQQALAAVSNVTDIEAFIRKREQADGKSYLEVCDLLPAEGPRIMKELELMGITFGSLFPGLDGICKDLKDRLFAEPV
ncbi:FRG domain-containing protein [Sphingomonas hengshuiensis]|uniref:FRG domain-containing protein n=1 Tax=Sphingomonas hengshuiensis TaxID=1609977 RepID=UPI00138E091C|nr:FRG domain-containing protein [Sphingomonas hengshuiensis]